MFKRRRAILGSLLCFSAFSSIEACTTTSTVTSRSSWESAISNFNSIGGNPYCINFANDVFFGEGGTAISRTTGTLNVDGAGKSLTGDGYNIMSGGISDGTATLSNITLGSGIGIFVGNSGTVVLKNTVNFTDMLAISIESGTCLFEGTKTTSCVFNVPETSDLSTYSFASGVTLTAESAEGDIVFSDDVTFAGPTPSSSVVTPRFIAVNGLLNTAEANVTIQNMILELQGDAKDDGEFILDGGTLSFGNSEVVIDSNKFIVIEAAGGGLETPGSISYTLENAISGSSGGPLTKKGTGTLILADTDNNQTSTIIEAGILQIASAGALGNNPVTIKEGATFTPTASLSIGTLTLEPVGTIHVNSNVTLSIGNLRQTGTTDRTLTISGGVNSVLELTTSSTYVDGFSVTNAELRIIDVGCISSSNTVTLGESGLLTFAGTSSTYSINNLSSSDTSAAVSLGSNDLIINLSSTGLACTAAFSGTGDITLREVRESSSYTEWALNGTNTGYTGQITIENLVNLKILSGENLGGSGSSVKILAGGKLTIDASPEAPITQNILLDGTGTNTIDMINGHEAEISGVISGTGQLSIGGDGILTLSGINGMSGGIAITGSELVFSRAANLGSSTQTISLKTADLTLAAFADVVTLNNPIEIDIEGTGGFFTVGAGSTLVLAGAISCDNRDFLTLYGDTGGVLQITADNSSTFDGNVSIQGGILEISSITNMGPADSTAELHIGQNDAGTTKGTLRVTGSLTTEKNLTGLDGTIDVVGSSTVATFTGRLSNMEVPTLVKIGAGRCEILPSSASASISNVVISEGVFAGNSDSLSTSSISTADGTTLVFYQTNSGTYVGGSTGGAISGGCDVEITGTTNGKILFQNLAANTYTGDTILTSGTLSMAAYKLSAAGDLIGNGGTFEATGSFTASNDIPLNTDTTTTFSVSGKNTTLTLTGTISGCGDYVKDGSGTLIVNGSTSECTVAATSEDSSLRASASSISVAAPLSSFPSVFVSQGVLGGTGSIGSVTVAPDAAVQGGGAVIGTLSILGDLTLQPGAILGVRLDPAEASIVDMTGVMTIEPGALVLAVPLPGNYSKPVTFTIAEALSNVVGRFATAEVMPGFFLNATLSYPTSTTVQITISPINLSGLVKGANAVATAKALAKIVDRNRAAASPSGALLTDVIMSLVPFVSSTSQMTYAMNQLHPALFKSMQVMQEAASVSVRESLSVRLQNEMDCKKEKRVVNVWLNGMGDVLNQHSGSFAKSPQIGYRSTMGGFTAGADYNFAKYFYVGALGGFTSAHMHYKENQGYGDANTGYGGLYFSAIGEMFYGNVSTIGGWSGYQAHRKIHYPGVSMQAKNHHGGRELLSHADTGMNFKWGRFTVRPFDSFDYETQTEDGFGEKDAGQWNLLVKKRNSIMLRNELGLQFAFCSCFSGTKISISPKLSWVREVRVKGAEYRTAFREVESIPFTVTGFFPDRSLISPGLFIIGSTLEDRLSFSLYYDGEFRGDYSANRVGGELKYGF